MIIGTAGHVDHGKTRLVQALTGAAGDRLAEERRRGITIDLGYAYAGPLGFVDVPGHERFVHTMLAGAAGIDAALLVVAADDGVMPQTREHAAILDLLGVARGVVAISKTDLAPGRVPAVSAQIRDLLAGGALAGSQVLPVSAVSGLGVEKLRAALLALGRAPRRAEAGARFCIDRVFTLAGIGIVVTGTLVAGRIAAGDHLTLSPSGIEVRVRGLHAHSRPAEAAQAGERAALNIAAARLAKDLVARGDWLVEPALHAPTAALDALVRMLPDAPALRPGAPVHLHLGAAHVTARIQALEAPGLDPGGTASARLVLDRPIAALAGDRLVMRDAAAVRTIGGGTVLDPFPPRRGRRTPSRLAALRALAAPAPAIALRGLLEQPPRWVAFGPFARARNIPSRARGALLEAAPAVLLADVAIAPPALAALRAALMQALAAHHAAAPDAPGLQPERLRVMCTRLPAAAFRALVETSIRRGEIAQEGPWLRLPTHRATLSPADERLWPPLRRLIGAAKFRPPRTRDLAQALALPEAGLRATLKRLARIGRLVEVAHDHFFLRETVAEMAGIAAALGRADARGVLTAAALRDRLDNGRKVAIQILEFFDRAGLTRRLGDERRVRADRLGLFGVPPARDAACTGVGRPASSAAMHKPEGSA
ncbi:MAG: selenocysteine-specific translation elongation factor [Acidisphaera sp.]|nr:selenocysteine-specific translation elongation factor [Acidisphaera sp.]